MCTETDGQWEISISSRRVGSHIRREIYNVSIRGTAPRHDECLSGFTNRQAALDAGRQRVTLLRAVRERARRRKQAHRQ